jgi:hypothetical protein
VVSQTVLTDVTEAEVMEKADLHRHALSYCTVLQALITEVGIGAMIVVIERDGRGPFWRALFRLAPTSTAEDVVRMDELLATEGGEAMMQDAVVVVDVTSANVLVTLSSVSTVEMLGVFLIPYTGKRSSVVVKCLSQDTTPRMGTRLGAFPQTAL